MMANLIPESPVIQSGFSSPDIGKIESSSSRRLPSPRFLHDPSPSTLLPLLEAARIGVDEDGGKGKGNDLRTRLILRHALQWGVERGDVELVAWLISLPGEWGSILDEEVQGIEDNDGWGIIGMAIESSCGRQDIEEIVRLVVSRWGILVGPRGGIEYNGWTPLHLASLISTPPLISFLLNRGASPHALTNRGLTPLDLVSGVEDRADIAVFLEHGSTSAHVPPTEDLTTLSARRQKMLSRRRQRAAEKLRKIDEEERGWILEQERERWIRDLASVVEVSAEILLPPSKRPRSLNEGQGDVGEDWKEEMDEDEEEGDEEEEVEDHLFMGSPKIDQDDTMLVFSLSGLPAIFDILISTYRPECAPLEKRSLPANALYLYARFAYYRCDESWLDELLDGAVERIEQGVYSNVEDLAYLAFWAYNSTVLLHLIKSDKDLAGACETEEMNLIGMIEELINAIHVFVIRVAERRIDSILDAAILDYETLEDFNDVRFEGEWTLFRTFGTRKKRDILPRASQIFNQAGTGASDPPPSPSLLGTLRDNVAAASPLKSLASRASIADLRSGHVSRSTSVDSLATVAGNGAALGDTAISPRQITDILSAVLMLLQLYEVNPAITIQAFSQIFFWIACELFNRVLTRKKYLCRSKAVQIRMNITVLEDWIRANGLPVQTGTKYFEPVNQLLTWLQCLSQVREFDTLIGTMQNLKSLNPLQMRRAVRDYRFEVNEGRMTEECAQYLAQLQRDWEKRRVQMSVDALKPSRIPSDSSNDSASTPIDDLFDGTTALADFIPQSAPECFGELLDSRYMLPFILPSQTQYLVATPPTGAAFSNANISTPFSDGTRLAQPSSRSSFTSSRPMGWALPEGGKLRRLPRDFFRWLREKETERRHQNYLRDLDQPRPVQPAVNDHRMSLPVPLRPKVDLHRLTALEETDDVQDEITPIVSSTSHPVRLNGFPSPGLRTSDSLDRLREQAKIQFEAVPHTPHRREESYEMRLRGSPISLNDDGENGTIKPNKSRLDSFHHGPDRTRPGIESDETPTKVDSGISSLTDEGEVKKRWWKLGRTASSSSTDSASGGEKTMRETSEDTIVRA